MQFKKLSDASVIDDIVVYIKEFITKYQDTHYIEVVVGCDSQNTRKVTQYGTVIVLHITSYDSEIGKGGHVLYQIATEPRPFTRTESERKDHRSKRLLNEAWKSIQVAEMLRDNGIHVNTIDLDMNPDPKFRSNDVLDQAMGWVQSMGITPRCKPDAVCASYAADRLVK